MVKAADALAEVGYSVRVVSVLNDSWASAFDPQVAGGKSWSWCPVDLRRSRRWARWLRTGLRRRVSLGIVRNCGVDVGRLPSRLLASALWGGIHAIIDEVCAEPADMVYAGTDAGLIVAPLSARRLCVPFAVDLEDLYSADEAESAGGALRPRVLATIESRYLGGTAFLTAGSEGIASAYASRHAVAPVPIHNVFPLPSQEPAPRPATPSAPRRLYWFSQTIGLDRGLQDVVRALGRSAAPCGLSLQGNPAGGAESELRRLAREEAPLVELEFLRPISPPGVLDNLARYDIGLAVEHPVSLNRAICLTNKALTYILGGMPVVMTDTPGQRRLAESLGEAAVLYPPGDVDSLTRQLHGWLSDDDLLRRAGRLAWQAAKERWHWEHPLERGALLECVRKVLGQP